MMGAGSAGGMGGLEGLFGNMMHFEEHRGRQPRRRARCTTPSSITHNVPLSLAELFTGTTKRMKVTHRLTDAASGQSIPVAKVLSIPVKPGWKEGTRVTFDTEDGEVVFVIQEKPHKYLVREGDDLVWTCHLSAEQIRRHEAKGLRLTLRTPAPGGEQVEVHTKGQAVHSGSRIVVPGKGMPIRGDVNRRGNFVVRFASTARRHSP